MAFFCSRIEHVGSPALLAYLFACFIVGAARIAGRWTTNTCCIDYSVELHTEITRWVWVTVPLALYLTILQAIQHARIRLCEHKPTRTHATLPHTILAPVAVARTSHTGILTIGQSHSKLILAIAFYHMSQCRIQFIQYLLDCVLLSQESIHQPRVLLPSCLPALV